MLGDLRKSMFSSCTMSERSFVTFVHALLLNALDFVKQGKKCDYVWGISVVMTTNNSMEMYDLHISNFFNPFG